MAVISRNFLLVGDKANDGAEITSSLSAIRHMNIFVVVEGSPVYCPVCKTNGVVKCIGPRLPNKDMGLHRAVSGDICVCRCNPPPVFPDARGKFGMTFDTDGEYCLHLSSGVTSSITTWAQNSERPAGLQILIRNSDTGETLKNRSYIANINGIKYTGTTDDNGNAKVDAKEGDIIDLHVLFESPNIQLNPR